MPKTTSPVTYFSAEDILWCRERVRTEAAAWEPIQTAPVNVPILVYCKDGIFVCEGHTYQSGHVRFWTLPTSAESEDVFEPTHWMLLPHRPK